MASSLISSDEASVFQGILEDHFETFKRTITVHKEPKRSVISNSAQVFAGYGTPSNTANVTLVPVSASFDAVVSYPKNPEKDLPLNDVNAAAPRDGVRIKVGKAARDYIETGRTEAITVDSRKFNHLSSQGEQHFLGLTYYVYLLQETK